MIDSFYLTYVVSLTDRIILSDNRAFVPFTCQFLHFSVSSELERLVPARRRRMTCRTADKIG